MVGSNEYVAIGLLSRRNDCPAASMKKRGRGWQVGFPGNFGEGGMKRKRFQNEGFLILPQILEGADWAGTWGTDRERDAEMGVRKQVPEGKEGSQWEIYFGESRNEIV